MVLLPHSLVHYPQSRHTVFYIHRAVPGLLASDFILFYFLLDCTCLLFAIVWCLFPFQRDLFYRFILIVAEEFWAVVSRFLSLWWWQNSVRAMTQPSREHACIWMHARTHPHASLQNTSCGYVWTKACSANRKRMTVHIPFKKEVDYFPSLSMCRSRIL